MALQEKIEHSLALIRKAERLALSMKPDHGFHVGFSGGKDSQVLLELVKMAGVKYYAEYSVTGNDPPENVRFIREKYPEVHLYHPEKKFIQLIATNGLPIRQHRYCCALLKEGRGEGCVVLTGVRADESLRRSYYGEVNHYSAKGREYGGKKSLEQVEENQHRCIEGKDKLMVYPILRWTEEDVWEFIRQHDLPVNPCYSKKQRVGCMLCPFASKKERLMWLKEYPLLRHNMVRQIQRYLDSGKGGKLRLLDNASDIFDFWIDSKDNVSTYLAKKRQTTLQLFNETTPQEQLP